MLVTERINRLVPTCLAGPFTKEIQQVKLDGETSDFFDDPRRNASSEAVKAKYKKKGARNSRHAQVV